MARIGPQYGRMGHDGGGRRLLHLGPAQAAAVDGLPVQVHARFRHVQDPVVFPVQPVQGLLYQGRQRLGTGPSGLQASERELLRQFHGAVVGRQGQEGVVAPDPLVEEGEEVRQLPVRTQGGVHGFLAEGPEIVADVVIGRETDDQDVRDVVLTQFFLDDRLPGEFQLVVGGPGRVLEGIPVPGPRFLQAAFRHVGEDDPAVPVVLLALADVFACPFKVQFLRQQAFPFAAEGLVRDFPLVEALDPVGHVVHEVAARRDSAQGRLEPVWCTQFPGGDHGAVVLERYRDGLAPVARGHAQFVRQGRADQLPRGCAAGRGGPQSEDVAVRIHQRRPKHPHGPAVPRVVDHPRLVGVGA